MLTLFFLAALSAAPDPRLDALLADLQSLEGDFVQTIFDDQGRMVERSSGSFALAAPELFRWHIEEPFEELIVADGTRVWAHDVELEQITVRDQQAAAARSPLYLIVAPEIAGQEYDVRIREDGVRTYVNLTPVTEESAFETAQLGFREKVLEALIIEDSLGQITEVAFRDVVRNTLEGNAPFQFIPPEGVDILDATELGSER